MSSRSRAQQQHESTIGKIEVGDTDPMSVLARTSGLPLCHRRRGLETCTRVAGHTEGHGGKGSHDHPSSTHVSAGTDGIAKKVW